MRLPFRRIALPCLSLCLLGVTRTHAATTVYTDRNAFLAALSSSYEEEFSSYAEGTVGSPLPIAGGGHSFTIQAYDEFWSPTGPLYAHEYGENHVLGAISSYNYVEFTFQSPINAFGGYFFGTDFMGDLYPGASMSFDLSDGTEYVLSNITNTSTFVGFITDDEDGWEWIDLDASPLDYATFDNLIVGTTVPEPSAMALAALGGLMVLRRKRR